MSDLYELYDDGNPPEFGPPPILDDDERETELILRKLLKTPYIKSLIRDEVHSIFKEAAKKERNKIK